VGLLLLLIGLVVGGLSATLISEEPEPAPMADDDLTPEPEASTDVEEDQPDEDDEPRWGGEESLGLLPPE
jgi:hypothetical protein